MYATYGEEQKQKATVAFPHGCKTLVVGMVRAPSGEAVLKLDKNKDRNIYFCLAMGLTCANDLYSFNMDSAVMWSRYFPSFQPLGVHKVDSYVDWDFPRALVFAEEHPPADGGRTLAEQLHEISGPGMQMKSRTEDPLYSVHGALTRSNSSSCTPQRLRSPALPTCPTTSSAWPFRSNSTVG